MQTTPKTTEVSGTPQQKTEHLPRLALQPGTRVLIKLGWGLDNIPDDNQAEIVGGVDYEYIILKIPPVPGLLPKLVPGTLARVRFLHEGAASEFKVSVISHITRPSLLVFLSYPGSMSTLNIRQSKRVQSVLPACLHSPHGEVRGSIANMSAGGCLLVADARGQAAARALEAGNAARLQVCLDADGTCSNTGCILRSVTTEQFFVHIGLSFTDEDQAFHRQLANYLEMVRHHD